MADNIVPVVQQPTKIPPPVAAGQQGAGALAEANHADIPILLSLN